ADPHLHEDLTQTWTAVKGEGSIEVDGEERGFAEGDEVAIEPGTPHRDSAQVACNEAHPGG
ncbi:MAG: cupin domain-containing protein, partial [Solirubrobacterales bacterium]